MKGRFYIGTSGWSYRHWVGPFYPEGTRPGDMLVFYAARFPTVELNASFYRLPFEGMVKSWREKAPEGFLFAAKGSRRITHYGKLGDVDRELQVFFDRLRGLGEHLGPILWQLPPTFRRDDGTLADFLRRLPKDVRHAFEFRHDSWLAPEVMALLREHGAACVSVSSRRMPMHQEMTADFVYLRFHGLAGGFHHDYTAEELRPWAEHVRAALGRGKAVFAYFNNDGGARAPKNARELIAMVE